MAERKHSAFSEALNEALGPVLYLENIGSVMRGSGKCHFSRVTVAGTVDAHADSVRAALRAAKAPEVSRESLSKAEVALDGLIPYVDELVAWGGEHDDGEGSGSIPAIGAGIESLACAAAFHLNNAARAAGIDAVTFEAGVGAPTELAAA